MQSDVSREALDTAKEEYNAVIAKMSAKELKDYASHVEACTLILQLAEVLHTLTPEYNKAKRYVDIACQVQDTTMFAMYTQKLNECLAMQGFDTSATNVLRRKKWLKVLSPLRRDVLEKVEWIRNNRLGAALWIKRQSMSPAKRKAAAASSARMRLSWAE